MLTKIELADLTDQQMQSFFYEHWFLKPSALPCNLFRQSTNKKYFSQEHQDELIDKYLEQKCNGIFLKVGAVKAVLLSKRFVLFEGKRN